MEPVKQNRYNPCYGYQEMKKERDLVMKVVKDAGGVLKYTSENLQGDSEIGLNAIQSDRVALKFAPEELSKGNDSIDLARVSFERDLIE